MASSERGMAPGTWKETVYAVYRPVGQTRLETRDACDGRLFGYDLCRRGHEVIYALLSAPPVPFLE